MKRIISILVLMFLIANIFNSAFVAGAIEETYEQNSTNSSNTAFASNYDTDSNLEEDNYIDISEGALLYSTFEKRNYGRNEQITVRFELAATLSACYVACEADGFIVVNNITNSSSNDSGREIYDVVLIYDGTTENPYFSLSIETNMDLIVYAEVFGFLSDFGLFISESSFDAAKEASYYYLVEIGQLTMEEFNELLQQDYSQIGVEISNTIAQCEIMPPTNDLGSSTLAVTNTAEVTTVSGNLGWYDDNNIRHPMQYNRVEIWDARYFEKLGTVYTNVSGDYSFSFTDSYSYRDIYVKIYAGGANSTVKTGNGGDYVYTSGLVLNVKPGDSINIGWDVDMTSDLGRAFQISQAINVATEYVKQMEGEYIMPIKVYYPHIEEESGCFYMYARAAIYICGSSASLGYPESYASWDVIMHEYGHHVQSEFGFERSPGGEHYIDRNLADLRESKDLGIRLAWGEAYPTVFSGMAQAYYASSLQNIATVGDTAHTSYNAASFDCEENNIRLGEACEASIIGVLWDLYDATSESHDIISFSHSLYWEMITNCDSENFSEFCNYYVNGLSTSDNIAFGKLLSYYKMAPSILSEGPNEDTIYLTWNANGTSEILENNRFDLIFLDENMCEILRIENHTSSTYLLSDTEENIVLSSDGTIFYVIIIAYQTSSPTTGGYYSEAFSIQKPHTHSYGPYFYRDNHLHIKHCSCGSYITEGHYIRESDVVDNRYARCLGCRVQLDLYEDFANSIMSTNTQVSINGSYILPSGIVVLVDEDIQAYLDGTLVFYHPDNVPTTQ